MPALLTSPFFVALLGMVATLCIWNALAKRRKGEAVTAAEKRLEKFMEESGLYEDVDMTSAAAAHKPTLIDKTAALLARQGVLGTLEQGDILAWINRRLVLAGQPRGWNGSEFLAFYALVVGSGVALSFLMLASGGFPAIIVAGVLVLAVFYPFAWLKRLVKTRQQRAFTELPDFLDDLVLSLSSGMAVLDEALERVVRDTEAEEVVSGRKHILVKEFGRAYREYKHGNRSREDAFADAADRIGIPEVDNFVEGINEAYRTGSPILEALQSMSDHVYTIYEQRMKEYIDKKSLSFVVALTCIMVGVMVIIAAPVFAQIISALSGGGG